MPASPFPSYENYLKSIQMKLSPLIRSIRTLEQAYPEGNEFKEECAFLKGYLAHLEGELMRCVLGKPRLKDAEAPEQATFLSPGSGK
jgi:hypothetical protein